jgi:hypothetical protein
VGSDKVEWAETFAVLRKNAAKAVSAPLPTRLTSPVTTLQDIKDAIEPMLPVGVTWAVIAGEFILDEIANGGGLLHVVAELHRVLGDELVDELIHGLQVRNGVVLEDGGGKLEDKALQERIKAKLAQGEWS